LCALDLWPFVPILGIAIIIYSYTAHCYPLQLAYGFILGGLSITFGITFVTSKHKINY